MQLLDVDSKKHALWNKASIDIHIYYILGLPEDFFISSGLHLIWWEVEWGFVWHRSSINDDYHFHLLHEPSVWPDLAKLCPNLKGRWSILLGFIEYLAKSFWYAFGQIFHCCKWPNIEQIIWSHCSCSWFFWGNLNFSKINKLKKVCSDVLTCTKIWKQFLYLGKTILKNCSLV